MRRALELAAQGHGLVSPSPLVGCVIVTEIGEIVGEGTYEYENVTHAEVIALNQAGRWARGATAYVSLEPHAHVGRTEPCTKALIEAGIMRVVCPIEDPNPLVSGRGFQELRDAGIEVDVGLFEREARHLNEKFTVWHKFGRPFVHLKLASSLDGRISFDRAKATAISSQKALGRVQDLRHQYDAILIGGNTALVDDPELTDRSGKRRRRPLARVVLDNRLRIRTDSKLAVTAREIPTIVVSKSKDQKKIDQLVALGIDFVGTDARDLLTVLEELNKRGIQSVLVEGGTAIAGAFFDARLIDRFTFIIAPIVIGGHAPLAVGGLGAESLAEIVRLREIDYEIYDGDIEITGLPFHGAIKAAGIQDR